MSVDELWRLHEQIVSTITDKIKAEKLRLENRLRQLGAAPTSSMATIRERSQRIQKARRPYPEVKPKYRDSSDPSVTWSGRGKLPRWLTERLSSGRKLEEFRIA